MDIVADSIREAINEGKLPDGAVLNQANLAIRFGVSRVPIREAMRQLQAEGLIESHAHKIAVVRSTTVEQLTEIFSLRALIEGWVIEQAVGRIDDDRAARARAINERLRIEPDHEAWLDLNTEFHDTLYEAAGCEAAMGILEPLRLRLGRYTKLWSFGAGDVHYPMEACAEHDEILASVVAGDAARARVLTEAHVHHTRDRVIEAGRRVRAGLDAG